MTGVWEQAIDKILRKAHFASAGNLVSMAAHFYEPPTDFMGGDFKGTRRSAPF